jgi:hypothetical protein
LPSITRDFQACAYVAIGIMFYAITLLTTFGNRLWAQSHVRLRHESWVDINYSYFNAVMGFILEALHAGYNPARIDIPIGKSKLKAISSGVNMG